jgi:hypothetical protein
MIEENTDGWEENVPGYIASYIKENKLFGYSGHKETIKDN